MRGDHCPVKISMRECAQEKEENLFHTQGAVWRTEAFPTKLV